MNFNDEDEIHRHSVSESELRFQVGVQIKDLGNLDSNLQELLTTREKTKDIECSPLRRVHYMKVANGQARPVGLRPLD